VRTAAQASKEIGAFTTGQCVPVVGANGKQVFNFCFSFIFISFYLTVSACLSLEPTENKYLIFVFRSFLFHFT